MSKTTKIGYCQRCNEPFEKIGKGSGARKFCSICAKNRKREQLRKLDKKRRGKENKNWTKKSKEQMKIYRARGTVQDKQDNIGSRMIGKPNENWDDEEWKIYSRKIKRQKRETIGGYQEMN